MSNSLESFEAMGAIMSSQPMLLLRREPFSIESDGARVPPPQLLKWIGNKQRFAREIASLMPDSYSRYFEPFVGSGAVLAALAPHRGIAGDVLPPLIEFWNAVKDRPKAVVRAYARMWHAFQRDPDQTYASVRESFNRYPSAFPLMFLSRSCYGGVVRFTKAGRMSTPRGAHDPISPESFAERVMAWSPRIQNTSFNCRDFHETMSRAGRGDVVYCDPPYVFSQSILYGAQSFKLADLWGAVEGCLRRGAKVLLSIDGSKKSGQVVLGVDVPRGLFAREMRVLCGRSMLRRFQKKGHSLEGEVVHDRLLLSW